MTVDVYLVDSVHSYDTAYSYLADESLESGGRRLRRGTFVYVPFGPRNASREAIVWSVKCTIGERLEVGDTGKARRLKSVLRMSEAAPLSDAELELCQFLSERYLSTLGEAVKCVRPYREGREKVGRELRYAELCVDYDEIQRLISERKIRNIGQIRILELLSAASDKGMTCREAATAAGVGTGVITTLEKHGYVKIYKKLTDSGASSAVPSGFSESSLPTYEKHTLNDEQQVVYDTVTSAIQGGGQAVFLLHGVTGSGKTEVYMQLISKVLESGGNVVMLVPEISLTPQMLSHFTARFGDDVAVLHSRLTDAQRLRQWQRIERGEAHVTLGARSAVFAPYARIDLLIMDEAHDSSYRSDEQGLRYHTSEVAEQRCRQHGVVLFGSATPDTDMFHRAADGEIGYLSMQSRAGNASLPTVITDDMRDAVPNAVFGKALYKRMKRNYEQGLQTILFVARRGFSAAIVCRECGRVMKCSRCNVCMTYHATGDRLICHYCGNTAPAPKICPKCGSRYLERSGAGTERIQSELERLFPNAGVLRYDADTTYTKGSHAEILRAFAAKEAMFLVGTQMVTKGHDFPDVTLVGVINADSLFNIPDFRAEERAFQVLTQVAGRAGRAGRAGEVVIQVYDADNYAVRAASMHSYEEFYKNEIIVRRNLQYPPFYTICKLCLSCKNDRAGYEFFSKQAVVVRSLLDELFPQDDNIIMLGPSRAARPKVNDRYKWQIVIKSVRREDAARVADRWIRSAKPPTDMSVSVIFE